MANTDPLWLERRLKATWSMDSYEDVAGFSQASYHHEELIRYLRWLRGRDRFTPKWGNGDPVSWSGDRQASDRLDEVDLGETSNEKTIREIAQSISDDIDREIIADLKALT